MFLKKKSVSQIELLLYLVLISIIVLVLFLVVKKHTTNYSHFFETTTSSISEFNKCEIVCLSDNEGTCKINNKEIKCKHFLYIVNQPYDISSISEGSNLYNALDIDIHNIAPCITYCSGNNKQNMCKVYDFLGSLGKKAGAKRIPTYKEIENNVKYTLKKYKSQIMKISDEEGVDPCILTSIIAIESSGGKEKKSKGGISCGITMITPENLKRLGYCSKKESDSQCCEKIMKDDENAIRYSAMIMKELEKVVSIKTLNNNYPIDNQGILKLAYLFAYYNGGNACFKPSKDCSFKKCNNFKKDPFLHDFSNIPAFLCAYNPGGCDETQAHVTKSIYAYKICRNIIK